MVVQYIFLVLVSSVMVFACTNRLLSTSSVWALRRLGLHAPHVKEFNAIVEDAYIASEIVQS